MRRSVVLRIFLILFLASSHLTCHKDTLQVELPAEVALGSSVVYLNGELTTDYSAQISQDTFWRLMNVSFVKQSDNYINSLNFAWLPTDTGRFELHTERIPYVKALTSFSQTVSDDLDGYEYKLVDPEDGFIIIERLDTINQEIKGRFRAKFKRTAKNGLRQSELTKWIQFDGVFYEKYQRY